MDRNRFLEVKALVIALDKLLSEGIEEEIAQAIVLSKILVEKIMEKK